MSEESCYWQGGGQSGGENTGRKAGYPLWARKTHSGRRRGIYMMLNRVGRKRGYARVKKRGVLRANVRKRSAPGTSMPFKYVLTSAIPDLILPRKRPQMAEWGEKTQSAENCAVFP